MGKEWDVDDILERALEEDDIAAMDDVVGRLVGEERISRSAMLRRSAAAAAGLTILSSPATAFARSTGAAARKPPLRGRNVKFADMVKEARKEGVVNTIALPPDWANYGEMMSTFKKKFRMNLVNDNPNASSAEENQAVRSLKGDKRAPDVLDVGPAFAVIGANEGLYAKYFNRYFGSVPRSMKDTRGFWVGDYWGVVSFGTNRNVVSNPPRSWQDLLKPEYKNRVALNGNPMSSGSAVAGVYSAALANGGSLTNIEPGIEFFARLKQVGNFIPVNATPQTIASGQTPIVIDWDYLNLGYSKQFPAARITTTVPSLGTYGAYYCQAINNWAPHPWAARLWQEFLYSDVGQLIWLKGYAHPARFNDMLRRKKIPQAMIRALPSPQSYAKVRFATPAQNAKARQTIRDQWPSKVGG
jgi:putative spermidine/putrescine transport system substrate-binding protein